MLFRSPSVSAQLHDIIHAMEAGALAGATDNVSVPAPTGVPERALSSAEVNAHRKALRKEARRQANMFSRRRRKAALAEAAGRHETWVNEKRESIAAEHQRLTALHNATISAWRSGDPATVYIVTNAILTASGAPGALVSLVDGVATLLVFAPALEDVHPSGPSYSSGGSPTIKKRTKPERQMAHRRLAGANAVRVLNSAKAGLNRTTRVEVVVVTMSSSTGELRDSAVIATFTADLAKIPRDSSGMMALIDRGALPRVLPLEAVLGDGFVNSGQAPAIAAGRWRGLGEHGPVQSGKAVFEQHPQNGQQDAQAQHHGQHGQGQTDAVDHLATLIDLWIHVRLQIGRAHV